MRYTAPCPGCRRRERPDAPVLTETRMALDSTHDPSLTSWVASAQGSGFPIQNLPFGVFRRRGTKEWFRGGVAIGDQIVDLGAAASVLEGEAKHAAIAGAETTLNRLMGMGPSASGALRKALSAALATGSDSQEALSEHLVAQADVEMGLPATIGDYTDFYSSIHHATNIGRLFRPENPLLPNYRWIPIGYHGRSSSIGVSPESFVRPSGQKRPGEDGVPGFGASTRMDYELELGVFVGKGNAQGDAVGIEQAEEHVFGICILNDWSARDIQGWEYQPLGPFLGKSFASTISPWIVTTEALAPFRAAFERPSEDPQPLPYLDSDANRAQGAFDIQLETLLETATMRGDGAEPTRLSVGNYSYAYWTVAQLVTHHTVNGCNLRPGDLLGTGTLSGPDEGMQGALIEITKGGKHPMSLPNGEQRSFLEDGDTVIMRAWCDREGAVRIGFGEATGTVLPAKG